MPISIPFLTELIKFLNSIVFKPSRQIAKVINIYDALHRVVENTNVQRVLIMKAHNGGGLIRPDTPLYVTVLYEDYTHPLTSIKADYQKIEVDEPYVRLLMDLILQKNVSLDVGVLKPSILKISYDSQAIKYAEMYYIRQNRRNLYFCSIVTTEEAEVFLDSKQRAEILLLLNTLKKNIV